MAAVHAGPDTRDGVVLALGGHPTSNALRALAAVGGGGLLALAALAVLLEGPAAILIPVLAFAWVIRVLFLLGALLGATANAGLFADAVAVVRRGRLTPDFIGRNALGSSIAIVDRRAREAFLNGRIVALDDLASVSYDSDGRGSHTVDLFLRGHDAAFERLHFDSEEAMMRFAALLFDAAGLQRVA